MNNSVIEDVYFPAKYVNITETSIQHNIVSTSLFAIKKFVNVHMIDNLIWNNTDNNKYDDIDTREITA